MNNLEKENFSRPLSNSCHLAFLFANLCVTSVSLETAEKVGFDDFPIQDTVVEKIQPHYFVGKIPDSSNAKIICI